MVQIPYVFNQLCALLPRDKFEYLVAKHGGNGHVKSYSCWNHFLVMLWAQLSGRESLRDIEVSLRAHRDKLYRLGMGCNVSRNTIAHANATRPVGLFRDFSQMVMQSAFNLVGRKEADLSAIANVLELTGMYAVDSSTVTLGLDRFTWAAPQDSHGGVKLHTMYDILREIPVLCLVTGHEERDQTFMECYPYKGDALYIFDKAYVKTASLRKINDLGAYFIVRRKRKMAYDTIREGENADPRILGDKVIMFTNRWAKLGYPSRLRLVQYYSAERNELLDFLTNNFKMKATDVADAYRNRWNIELFFRWLKQHLYVTRFYGTSANAVLIQIYTAVSAYCLVAMAASLYRFEGPLYDFLRILGVSLLEKVHLTEIIMRYKTVPPPPDSHAAEPSLFGDAI